MTNRERRLAAIMAADVVEYSSMMAEDEDLTLQALQEHQFALLNPTIGQFHGRIVKYMGDGVLVEFHSVTEAVQCAVALQKATVLRNGNLPEQKRIRYRIGINLGDIISDGEDIFGDGVNVAARLEEIAEPNGIAISGPVYAQVDDKLDENFSDAGAHHLKNIKKAVRVYQFNAQPTVKSVKVAYRPFIDLPVQETPLFQGGCLCNSIRYEITGKALGSMLCHCRMCQKYSGAPMLEGTTFAVDDFRLTKGKPNVFRSSSIAERGFCPTCGSPIFFQGIVGHWKDWIVITTGSLDEPHKFPPTYHLGIESSLPWLHVLDDLPRTSCRDSPSLVEAYRMVGEEVP